MNLLALETSTEACSVALWIDGDVRERFEIAPRRHAELVLPWAGQLLADAGIVRAQLDAIAVGRGPGAFTGVRLGLAIGQGIALALGLPMLPASTLAVLARQGLARGQDAKVLAAIDARMGEVYFAAFQVGTDDVELLSPEIVANPQAVALPDGNGWHGIGTGFAAQDAALQTHLQPCLETVDGDALPHAADLASLAATAFRRGELVAPDKVEPAYLRDNVALTIAEQQALRAARQARD